MDTIPMVIDKGLRRHLDSTSKVKTDKLVEQMLKLYAKMSADMKTDFNELVLQKYIQTIPRFQLRLLIYDAKEIYKNNNK